MAEIDDEKIDDEKQVSVIVKDEFIRDLLLEFKAMFFKKPRCSFEYGYNDALEDIVDSLESFLDTNPGDEILIDDNQGDD